MEMGVAMTPALAIDGEPMVENPSGR
ncbi:MAG: hypothetical protein U5P10_13695 [Spirochaetia bacterium]|nr:hypothetical protein [Spirochaetia bacterium]